MGSVAKGMPEVIGREPELAMLEEFLDGGAAWLALLLTGGPGIGKTALWEQGLGLAADRDIRVLSARPSGAEAELSFAGLFDLLEGIDIESVSGLPAPQRRALAQAEESGETRFGAVLTLHLCELELRAGELREASRLLDEWAESGATEGHGDGACALQLAAGLAARPPR